MSSTARTARDGLVFALLAALAPACAHTGGGAAGDRPGGVAERAPADPSVVTADEIERAPAEDVEEMLRGRVAGVQVVRSSAGIIVHIRGTTSIVGSDQPLYVIDGVPIEPDPDGSVPVQPYDIESIRVLKDAVSTSMYGVRGANGVIIITTKQPRPDVRAQPNP